MSCSNPYSPTSQLSKGKNAEVDGAANLSTLHLSFFIGGMTCASCAQRLASALRLVSDDVVSATVSFLTLQADVVIRSRDSAAVTAAVMGCVAQLGFTVLGDDYASMNPNRRHQRAPRFDASTSGASSLTAVCDPGRAQYELLPKAATNNASAPAPMSREQPRFADTCSSTSTLVAAAGGPQLSSSGEEEDAREEEASLSLPSSPKLTAKTTAATTTTLLIEGMSCSSCAARIEGELLRVDGVAEASVNFAVMSGRVIHDTRKVTAANLLGLIQSLGYQPSLQSSRLLSAPRPTTHGQRPQKSSNTAAASVSIVIDDAEHRELERIPDKRRRPGECCRQQSPPPPPLPVSLRPGRGEVASDMEPGSPAGGATAKYIHRFLVEGMSCASCASRIERVLMAFDYVTDCTVSFTTGSATVMTDRSFTDDNAAIEEAIRSLGHGVTALGRRKGDARGGPSSAPDGGEHSTTIVVHAATGDCGGDEASDLDDAVPDVARTRAALERQQEIANQRANFTNSAILSVPLAIAMLIMAFTDLMETLTMALIVDAVQMVCATPIVLVFGRQFFRGAWGSFQHGAYTMDTLVAIGTGCSYAYSVVALAASCLMGVHLMTYFDTAGMLTTFMLLGRYLEANAKRTTSGALIELMSLVPAKVTVVTGDGDIRVSTDALRVGDHVRVLAGDRIPVDGTIVEGQSDVDEQLLTGESIPKLCSRGDAVVGGTLNITGTLLVVVDRVGEDTTLSQILRVVQEAQNTKPAVQRVADRMAMYFVPFVVVSSLLTLAVWLFLGFANAYPPSWRPHGMPPEAFAFNFFIATVVAACPCALGLATPTAIMVGTGVGAKSGVLVKSGVTLESVRQTNCIVFDKTGTITDGQLKVCSSHCFHVAQGAPLLLVKQLVVAVEEQSTHPIAKAVVRDLKADVHQAQSGEAVPAAAQVDVLAIVTHAGKGLEATVALTETYDGGAEGRLREFASGGGQFVQQYSVLVGNLAFMKEQHQTVSQETADTIQRCHSRGQTTVVAAVDGTAVLVLALADVPKREAFGVMEYLHRHGIRTLMVTGDNRLVAVSVARAVGISFDSVYAEALPATKAEIVKALQEEGQKVMFVGDGINDSPALAQANVGVALGAGTEVAMEAADAVLVRNSLVDLLSLRRLSQVTVRRIYGNFAWAFGYNLLMLPLASGLLFPLLRFQLPPVVAGVAMVLSSLSVLTSSLTIRFFKPYQLERFTETTWR